MLVQYAPVMQPPAASVVMLPCQERCHAPMRPATTAITASAPATTTTTTKVTETTTVTTQYGPRCARPAASPPPPAPAAPPPPPAAPVCPVCNSRLRAPAPCRCPCHAASGGSGGPSVSRVGNAVARSAARAPHPPKPPAGCYGAACSHCRRPAARGDGACGGAGGGGCQPQAVSLVVHGCCCREHGDGSRDALLPAQYAGASATRSQVGTTTPPAAYNCRLENEFREDTRFAEPFEGPEGGCRTRSASSVRSRAPRAKTSGTSTATFAAGSSRSISYSRRNLPGSPVRGQYHGDDGGDFRGPPTVAPLPLSSAKRAVVSAAATAAGALPPPHRLNSATSSKRDGRDARDGASRRTAGGFTVTNRSVGTATPAGYRFSESGRASLNSVARSFMSTQTELPMNSLAQKFRTLIVTLHTLEDLRLASGGEGACRLVCLARHGGLELESDESVPISACATVGTSFLFPTGRFRTLRLLLARKILPAGAPDDLDIEALALAKVDLQAVLDGGFGGCHEHFDKDVPLVVPSSMQRLAQNAEVLTFSKVPVPLHSLDRKIVCVAYVTIQFIEDALVAQGPSKMTYIAER